MRHLLSPEADRQHARVDVQPVPALESGARPVPEVPARPRARLPGIRRARYFAGTVSSSGSVVTVLPSSATPVRGALLVMLPFHSCLSGRLPGAAVALALPSSPADTR